MNSPAMLDFVMVVLERPGGRALVGKRGVLPRVRVLDSEMRYRDLARELWRRARITIYILDNLRIDGEHVCIARPTDTVSPLRQNSAWVAEQDLQGRDTHLVRICQRYQLSREGGPLSYRHFSALDVLRDWYQPVLHLTARHEEHIEHWQSTADSALLRIETNRNAVWLKSVGEEYGTEPAISQNLARLSPGDFPIVIAANATERYMLFEDVPGDTLHQIDDASKWMATAERLAELQAHFVPIREPLLAAGCADWSARAMHRAAPEFFSAMEQTMAAQTSSQQPRLGAGDLAKLQDHAMWMCDSLADCGVPDTLTHANFSPHNVIWSEGRPVFLDWAFGIVSFPFISIEYFRIRMERDCAARRVWSIGLVEAYYRAWRDQIESQALCRGRALVPAAAPLIAALNLYFQRSEAWIDDPIRGAALRTLVRTFAREVQHISTSWKRPMEFSPAEVKAAFE